MRHAKHVALPSDYPGSPLGTGRYGSEERSADRHRAAGHQDADGL